MKFMLTMILATLIGGCQWMKTSPENEPIVHGYETEDGTVVRYSDVETGRDSAKDGGQKDDYSDRATAR